MSERWTAYAAMALAGLVTALTIRFGAYVPWGTDPASYIAAGEAWAEGSPVFEAALRHSVPVARSGRADLAFGFAITAGGAITSWYPLGLPVLIAAGFHAFGEYAGYLVAPLFAGLLTWCVYLLGTRLAGSAAGLSAAVLTAASPLTLSNAILPMSDIPAAALWASTFLLALRPGGGAAAAAGATTSLAIMLRPNLAPLGAAGALMLVLADAPGTRWRRLLWYGGASAIGPALVLWSQAVFFGHPLTTGYGDAISFDSARIPANLLNYAKLLVDLYGWYPLAVLALPAPPVLRRIRASRQATVIVLGALATIGVNLVLYLPYHTYDGWFWLRFLLPGIIALFLLLSAVVAHLRAALQARLGVASWLVFLLVPLAAAHPQPRVRDSLDTADFRRVDLMVRYLREVAPRNAVYYVYLQSAAVFGGARRPILRMDMIPSERFEPSIIEAHAYGLEPWIILDDQMERDFIGRLYQGSPVARMDWPARAAFVSGGGILLYDPLDRERFLNGEWYPTDVIGDVPTASVAPAAPPGHWPVAAETRAFRTDLEMVYQHVLGHGATTVHAGPDDAVTWLPRYLRYRLSGCSHEEGAARTLAQLDGGDVAPLCGDALSVDMPARHETFDFRRRLEDAFRGRSGPPRLVHVDLEGEAVWVSEYLRLRAAGSGYEQARQAVRAMIVPDPAGR